MTQCHLSCSRWETLQVGHQHHSTDEKYMSVLSREIVLQIMWFFRVGLRGAKSELRFESLKKSPSWLAD